MEDIEMKDENAIKEKEEKIVKPIYQDFIITLTSIAKNVTMKDLKTLDINYRLLNK